MGASFVLAVEKERTRREETSASTYLCNKMHLGVQGAPKSKTPDHGSPAVNRPGGPDMEFAAEKKQTENHSLDETD